MSRLSRAIEQGRKAYFEQKGRPYRTAPHPDFIPYYDVEFFKQLQAHRRQEDEQRWARMKTQLVPIHPPEPELSGSTVDAADPDIPPAQPAPPVPARRGDRHGAAKADQPSSAEARKGFLGWPWFGQKQSTSAVGDEPAAIQQFAVDDPTHSDSPTKIAAPSSNAMTRRPDDPISSTTKTKAVPQFAPVPIGEVADSIAKYLREYLVCSDQQLVVLVLWIIHTYCFQSFPVTPYLSISSPEKQSGKTVCLQLLRRLCHNPWAPAGVRSPQLIARIAHARPTLLLDDWHTVFRSSETQSIISFLNAGAHQEGLYPLRAQDEQSDQSVFCPKAFAGVGRLPASLADRSIPIVLQRGKPQESVRPFWLYWESDVRERVKEIPAWAKDNSQALNKAGCKFLRAPFPGLSLRQRECVVPLLAIAEVMGGKWPKRAHKALADLFSILPDEDPSTGLQLLGDIRVFFAFKDDPHNIFTVELLEFLNKLKDRPWTTGKAKPLNGQCLRRILRPYDIPCTSSQRIGDETRKGFTIRHFVDAWQRYTPELWQGPAPPQGAKGTKDHQVSAPDHQVDTNELQVDTNGPEVGTKAHQVVTNPEIGANNLNVFSVCAGVPT